MTHPSLTGITHRDVQGVTDAMRVRQLLIDTYRLVGREFNWDVRHWEGTYWCVLDVELAQKNWDAHTHIWETAEGEIVGAAVPDGPGDVALQIHPHYRALEDAILDWAEEHISRTTETGQRELIAWAFDWDSERQERLDRRGHELRSAWFWHHRRRTVSDPLPALTLPDDYVIRSVTPDEADVERWVACSNRVFGQAYQPEHHRNFQRHSPSHNYDLHVIAETPGGSFAAFAGLTVDPVNRFAVFEPVGTHPDHQRKGLARGVMVACLRRLQQLGTADVVYVQNWGTADAAKLYAAVGLEHYATYAAWVKVF